MKKTIRLTESDLIKLVKRVINEENERIITNYDRKYDYKSIGDKFFYKLKNTENWIEAKGKGLNAIRVNVFKIKNDKNDKPKKDNKVVQNKNKQIKNVLVSDTLINKNIVFDIRKETTPLTCTQDGCAQWVSDQLSELGVPRQGHAWHSHNRNQNNMIFTSFMNINPSIQEELAKLFTQINLNPTEKSFENSTMTLVKNLIPKNQSNLKDILKVNDIVGLYYGKSSNFTKAFFEGATGYHDMGSGSKDTDGPYFIKKDGTGWTKNDLGKNITFFPGKSLKNGSGFGMNTHLGYVGAIVDGEPIIFHNIHNTVHATPLSKMSNIKIFWIARPGTGKTVSPKETQPQWFEKFVNFNK